jgi:hypothetical protein
VSCCYCCILWEPFLTIFQCRSQWSLPARWLRHELSQVRPCHRLDYWHDRSPCERHHRPLLSNREPRPLLGAARLRLKLRRRRLLRVQHVRCTIASDVLQYAREVEHHHRARLYERRGELHQSRHARRPHHADVRVELPALFRRNVLRRRGRAQSRSQALTGQDPGARAPVCRQHDLAESFRALREC